MCSNAILPTPTRQNGRSRGSGGPARRPPGVRQPPARAGEGESRARLHGGRGPARHPLSPGCPPGGFGARTSSWRGACRPWSWPPWTLCCSISSAGPRRTGPPWRSRSGMRRRCSRASGQMRASEQRTMRGGVPPVPRRTDALPDCQRLVYASASRKKGCRRASAQEQRNAPTLQPRRGSRGSSTNHAPPSSPLPKAQEL